MTKLLIVSVAARTRVYLWLESQFQYQNGTRNFRKMIDEDLTEYNVELSEPYRYLKLPATKQLPCDHMPILTAALYTGGGSVKRNGKCV